MMEGPTFGPPYLIVASDETAERIFDRRFSVEEVESPEPDLERVHDEIGRVASYVGDSVKICVTLKSKFCRPSPDRYAETLAGNRGRVAFAAVASVEDGVLLRMFGVRQRILLLYIQDPAQAHLFETFQLEPAAASSWWLQELRRQTQRTIPMHVWVDTGLGREGVLADDALGVAGALRTGELAGLATHLAAVPYRYADGSLERDPPRLSVEFTNEQCRRFEEVRATINRQRAESFCCHAASSGAIQHGFRLTYYDMVRPGRMLVERFARGRVRQGLSIRTTVHHARVADVKHLPAGWGLGYLGSAPSTTPATVAVLTTSAGTDLRSGPVSLLKGGRRYTLPVAVAHGGMCVVRAESVPIEPGDIVDLNHPSGARQELLVPLGGGSFDGALYDPIRKQTLALGSWRKLRLRLKPSNRRLLDVAARSRYWAAP